MIYVRLASWQYCNCKEIIPQFYLGLFFSLPVPKNASEFLENDMHKEIFIRFKSSTLLWYCSGRVNLYKITTDVTCSFNISLILTLTVFVSVRFFCAKEFFHFDTFILLVNLPETHFSSYIRLKYLHSHFSEVWNMRRNM